VTPPAGEVLNLLAECSPVVGCSDAGERRLVCDLGDSVRAESCGLQAAIRLRGEVGLYIGGQPAGPCGVEEVLRHIGCKTPQVSQELGWLTIAHLLGRKQLADALASQWGQPTHQLGPQCGVTVPFGRRDDDVLDLLGISVVQLRDDMKEFSGLAPDTGQGKLRLGRSAQNGGSRTATLDTSAGGEMSSVFIFRRGHQCGDVVAQDTHVLARMFAAARKV
jgi:hypothetical protein